MSLMLQVALRFALNVARVANTCEYDVVSQVAALANDDDTLVIPAGQCDWGNKTLTLRSGIHVRGAGKALTTIRGSLGTTNLIRIDCNNRKQTTLSHLGFIGKADPALWDNGLTLVGGCKDFVVSQCSFREFEAATESFLETESVRARFVGASSSGQKTEEHSAHCPTRQPSRTSGTTPRRTFRTTPTAAWWRASTSFRCRGPLTDRIRTRTRCGPAPVAREIWSFDKPPADWLSEAEH